MSDAVWLLAWLGVTLALGGATVRLACGREAGGPGERLGLTLALGAGALAYVLFLAGLAGLAPSRGLLLGAGALAAGALAWSHRHPAPAQPPPAGPDPSWGWVRWAGGAGLALALGGVGVLAFVSGMIEWDTFAIWDFKGRVLLLPPAQQAEFLSAPALAFSHPAYPPGWALQFTAVYALLGRTDGLLAKLPCLTAFLAAALLAFAGLRHWLGRADLALAAAALVLVCPATLDEAGSGYADFAVFLFVFGALHYLARWLTTARRADLALGALFALCLAHTKNEGLAVAAMLGLTLLAVTGVRAWRAPAGAAVRRQVPLLLLAVVAVAGALVPLLVWKARLPALDEAYGQRLTWAVVHAGLARLPVVVAAFADTFAQPLSWGGFWFLLPVAAALGWRAWRQPAVGWLWLLLAAHLGLYVGVYLISPHDLRWHLQTSIHRLTLHLLPAGVLLLACHWRAARAPAPAAAEPCETPTANPA